jgi:hypothetical protein
MQGARHDFARPSEGFHLAHQLEPRHYHVWGEPGLLERSMAVGLMRPRGIQWRAASRLILQNKLAHSQFQE